MKNWLGYILMLIFLGLFLTGCGNSAVQSRSTAATKQDDASQAAIASDKKYLVVYFSHSGNTEALAQQIRQKSGADLEKIETVVPYTAGYHDLVRQAREELETGFQPELKPFLAELSSYDVIFLGSPNWSNTIASPIISFLAGNEQALAGKTIIPFMTHEGGGLGRTMAHLQELCPQAEFREGLAIRGRDAGQSQEAVDNWFRQLQIN